jgi:hypothetical protein
MLHVDISLTLRTYENLGDLRQPMKTFLAMASRYAAVYCT